MALSGTAFLCIWNDIEFASQAEYEHWHTQEHVPERVASPGFLSGQRYGAFDRAENRYLTLYDLASMQALETPEYADLQHNPTPWSARMRPNFRNVMRIPFELVASNGEGRAAHIAVIVFEIDDRADGPAQKVADILETRRLQGHCAVYHVGRALKVPAYGVFGLSADDSSACQKIIAILEVTAASDARQALDWMRAEFASQLTIFKTIRAEVSELLFSVGHAEVVKHWQRSLTANG